MSKPTALIAGATGLIGEHLLQEILDDDHFSMITLLVREKLEIENERINQVLLPNFNDLKTVSSEFNVDHIFCSLGTTLKNPRAKDMFRRVNLDYPLKMAKMAKKQPNFKCFHALTSVGATKSAVLYYNTVKGQLETALEKQNLRALKIYRPSLLIGKRKHTSSKEEIMKLVAMGLSFLVIKKQQVGPSCIHAETVAKTMLQVAKFNEPGTEVFKPRDMKSIVESSKVASV